MYGQPRTAVQRIAEARNTVAYLSRECGVACVGHATRGQGEERRREELESYALWRSTEKQEYNSTYIGVDSVFQQNKVWLRCLCVDISPSPRTLITITGATASGGAAVQLPACE